MTIRPGEPWGEVVEPPAGLVVAADDGTLARLLDLAAGDPVLVTGGDLLRTIGGPSRDGQRRRYPLDLLRVELDGAPAVSAVAHVVVRRPGRLGWWRGPLWMAANVSHLGPWDVAPRAHPNDGRLDVVVVAGTMSVRTRRQARRRLRTGSHLPHPDITVTRAATATWRPGRGAVVIIDGGRPQRADAVTVTVDPDAALVHA